MAPMLVNISGRRREACWIRQCRDSLKQALKQTKIHRMQHSQSKCRLLPYVWLQSQFMLLCWSWIHIKYKIKDDIKNKEGTLLKFSIPIHIDYYEKELKLKWFLVRHSHFCASPSLILHGVTKQHHHQTLSKVMWERDFLVKNRYNLIFKSRDCKFHENVTSFMTNCTTLWCVQEKRKKKTGALMHFTTHSIIYCHIWRQLWPTRLIPLVPVWNCEPTEWVGQVPPLP